MDIILGVFRPSCRPDHAYHFDRFFDDIDLLRQRWRSENTENVAELYGSLNRCSCVISHIVRCLRLIDFFRYYSREFSYNLGVASIRAGLLKKESKGWQNDVSLTIHEPRFTSYLYPFY